MDSVNVDPKTLRFATYGTVEYDYFIAKGYKAVRLDGTVFVPFKPGDRVTLQGPALAKES